VKSGKVAVRGNKLVLRTAVADMSPADRRLMDRVIDAYDRSGFNSPRPEELPEILGAPAASLTKLLGLLYDDGTLIRLSKNVVLSYNHLKQAQDLVVQTIQEKGSLDSADFKQAIGSTRKYALAILDYFDSRRVTMRNDNIRKLSPDYERNLL